MTRTLHAVASLDEQMGGSVRAVLDTSRHLVERGETTLVVATAAPKDSHGYLSTDYGSVDYRLFPRRFPRHYFRSPQLRRWLRHHVREFDLVELHGVFSFVPLYAAWACVRSGTPFTVRPHGSLDPFDLSKHAMFKRIYGRLFLRTLLSRTACVILTAELESERLETYGSSPERVVIPLPVESTHEVGALREGAEIPTFRGKYNIPKDALVVLFLGRFDHKKGLQYLIPSLAALKKSYPNLWFVLAGAGDAPSLARVNSLIDEYGIAPWTTSCGFLAARAKQSAFAASDVFALPSLNENLGIAIVEAMLAGLPVVISDQVYIHDLLSKHGAAIVCEPTIPSCTAGLDMVLGNEPLRREMGARAPQAAETLFGPDAVMPQLLELYRRVSSESSPELPVP